MTPPFRIDVLPAKKPTAAKKRPGVQGLHRPKHRMRPSPTKKMTEAVLKVGIWDVSSRVSYLYELVDRMNQSQKRLRFFEVVSSTPLGVEASHQVLAQGKRGKPAAGSAKQKRDDGRNVVASRLFPRLQRIRLEHGLHYLIGAVGPSIYDDDEAWLDEPYYDLSATWRRSEGLISIDGYQALAREAGVSFEAAVGYLVLCALGCLIQGESLIHEDTRGCIFDYDPTREDSVASLRAFTLCDICRKVRFKRRFGPALLSLLADLKTFESPHALRRRKRPV
jgi:hypothetical protein